MALPWIIAAIGGGLLAAEYRKERQRRQQDRYHRHNDEPQMVLRPSEWFDHGVKVTPRPGCLVACHVYGAIEHVGLWADWDQIIELHGSGLVRVVSARRFLKDRTGQRMFVCVDRHHRPMQAEGAIERAVGTLYQYRKYDLFEDNCYRYIWYCVTGEHRTFDSFGKLNEALAKEFNCDLYWDGAKLS
ncbi:hypothetical protein [Ferrimonas aestuarii]|uniref:LRAT domain-containing protein n=1 Tax=Ferrimonas aestuarii TaxID=2569539 RepID=A0A4V5NYX0_9GAMM|nr:hypothetical protein [Ferrimonas aestuarii]TKB57332.1 hypothetical protein FCL42_03380 [Ferrimonas aestuarii]